jgi:hypothetical protein
MIVNGIEYGFKIEPYFNKIKAEIYRFSDVLEAHDGSKYKMPVIEKDFGSIFRKPIEKDYLKAREWVDNQMKYISNANTYE